MSDLSEFKPESLQELIERILSVISKEGKIWWEKTREAVEVHVKMLSRAIITTQTQVSAGDMTQAEAQYFFDDAKQSFETVIPFTKYMGAAAAHRIVKETLKIVGWAVYNLTGVNFFPDYVSPND